MHGESLSERKTSETALRAKLRAVVPQLSECCQTNACEGERLQREVAATHPDANAARNGLQRLLEELAAAHRGKTSSVSSSRQIAARMPALQRGSRRLPRSWILVANSSSRRRRLTAAPLPRCARLTLLPPHPARGVCKIGIPSDQDQRDDLARQGHRLIVASESPRVSRRLQLWRMEP